MKKDEALKRAREALLAAPTAYRAPETIAFIDEALAEQPAQQEPTVAAAWQQGYDQGVADERTSEANIGIAGFDAKVNPARNNPYSAKQPAQHQEPVGAVYRYGKDSSGKPWHGARWTASGLDLPDGTLIYTSPPAQRKPLTDDPLQGAVDWLLEADG